jgi:hypothetical protein
MHSTSGVSRRPEDYSIISTSNLSTSPSEISELSEQYHNLAVRYHELSQEKKKRINELKLLIEVPGDNHPQGLINVDGIKILVEVLRKENPANYKVKKLEDRINDISENMSEFQEYEIKWIRTLGELNNDLSELYLSNIKSELNNVNYKECQIFQKLYDAYPYGENFTLEDKAELRNFGVEVSDLVSSQVNKSTDWFTFPLNGPRIPEEMNNVHFQVSDWYKANRLQLEFGINSSSSYLSLDGFNFNHKLNSDLEELEKTLEKGNEFTPKEDTLIFKEYKIHLMPKPEKVYGCMSSLLESISKNEEIKKHFSLIKVTTDPYDVHEDAIDHTLVTPCIVIYPKFGKEHAQAVLDFISETFSSSLHDLASHQVPRYNIPGANGLFYYSQGDSSRKTELIRQKPEVSKKIFNTDYTLI